MCIAFISTAHPKYALILIDNRDEFVLRPTSRPHWWDLTSPTGERTTSVLSSRDLQRPERGTWLGITRDGLVAVLTNFREQSQDQTPSPHGRRSRGGMVTAWLGQPPDEGVRESVARLVADGEGVQGVGGFSMVCGKLRKRARGEDGSGEQEGFAIVSNRAGSLDDVPIVGPEQVQGWGLTNTAYAKSHEWPKVSEGLGPFNDIVRSHGEAAAGGRPEGSEEELVRRMFSHLDTDTLEGHRDRSLAEHITNLKNSIFIPPLGGEQQRAEMDRARAGGEKGTWLEDDEAVAEKAEAGGPGFDEGMYGTQRQTVLLVGRDGNVTFVERALWDAHGNSIPRGEGDVTVRFKVEGWDD